MAPVRLKPDAKIDALASQEDEDSREQREDRVKRKWQVEGYETRNARENQVDPEQQHPGIARHCDHALLQAGLKACATC